MIGTVHYYYDSRFLTQYLEPQTPAPTASLTESQMYLECEENIDCPTVLCMDEGSCPVIQCIDFKCLVSIPCGPVQCINGEVCCNFSCGIWYVYIFCGCHCFCYVSCWIHCRNLTVFYHPASTPMGETCPEEFCEHCGDVICQPDEVCCSESCSLCAPPDSFCTADPCTSEDENERT
jgi:hypothetical protein